MPKHIGIREVRTNRKRCMQAGGRAGKELLPTVRKGFNIHDYPWLVATDRASEDPYYVKLVEVWSLNRSFAVEPDRRSEPSWAWRNPA